MASAKLLAGLRVVDAGLGLPAAIVQNFLSDNGAEVLRVEPAEGDPFYDAYPVYPVWRRATRIVPGVDAGGLAAMLADADVLILGGEDHPDVTTRYDAKALAAANPKLVVLDIAANPPAVTDAAGPAADLLAQARSGLSYEHYSDRPVLMAFQPACYGAALQGLTGALGALIDRERSGLGQIVSTSLYEGTLTWVSQLWTIFGKPTFATEINQPKDPWPLIFRCSDGVWVHLVMGSAGSKYQLYQGLGIDDPSVGPTASGMPDVNGPPRNFYGDIDLLTEYVAKFDSATLLANLQARGFPTEPSNPPGLCWDTEQAAANELTTREADGIRRIDMGLIAQTTDGAAVPDWAAADYPLGGMRIVDFGAFVAGPLASVPLHDLGAEVIKIETPAADPNRQMIRSFTAANRGKRCVVLDLKSAEGVATAHALAASAVATTNNFRPGVSKKLAVDPETLHGLAPELVVLESPGFGATGPLAGRGAFDPLMQAYTGHEVRAAGKGNGPFWNRTFMVDFAGGMLGAISVLTGVLNRLRTGEGATIVSPLFNVGAFLLAELIQHGDGNWDGLPELNAGRTGITPLEAFYELGDGWIALVARGQRAKETLKGALGIEALDEESIAAALRPLSTADVQARFAGSDVWIEPCRIDMQRPTLTDPALVAAGTIRISQNPNYGEVREIGTLFRFSRSRRGTNAHLQTLGEDTEAVVATLREAEPAE